MTPQELKNSILQLAIQGKLVEQRPEEGTAEELYREIQAEKQRLIKAGKVKKEKPLPEITDEEKPFDIPESWMWVRLGNAISLLSGTDFKPNDYNDQGTGIPYITGASSLSSDGVLINRWTERPTVLTYYGDVLLVCKGSGYGKTVICNIEKAHIARQIMAIRNLETLCMKYIRFFLMASIVQIKLNGQGVIPGIDRGSILNLVFPLPPLAEQKRIVAKIEELLPHIDRYEQAWSRLEDFNKRFPDDMKKSILWLAIQGKLVEQRPEEGTAEELYQQIQVEKQRLIEAGKIKKEKPLPEIAEDEKPFHIPESWKWVRLQQLALIIVDCPHSTPPYYDYETNYCAIDTNCIDSSGSITMWRYVDEMTYLSRIVRLEPQENDIVYTREGSICRAAILPNSTKICLGQRVMLIRCPQNVSPQYIQQFLMAPQTVGILTKAQKGIGAKHVNVSDVCRLLFPLPPLAEQKRIVEKLEELLPLCERLRKE